MHIGHKLIVVLLAVGLAGFCGIATAGEFAKVGTVGSQFLKIPVGARGTAMGNAFSTISDDISSPFWNPAGLVFAEGTQVMVERVEWLADMGYNAIVVSHQVENVGTIGLFVTAFSSGDMDETTVQQPDGTGRTFDVTNMLIGGTYAFRLTDKFSFGANLKYVREDLDGDVANSWAVDMGTRYDTGWKTLRLTMNIRNFGPEIQLGGTYYDYDNGTRLEEPSEYLAYHFPMIFRLGLAADPWVTPEHRLTIAAELEHPNDNLERLNVGGEYAFTEMFFLRGGYTFGHDTLGMSAGLGAEWNNFGVDYAYSDYGILEAVHRFCVRFSF